MNKMNRRQKEHDTDITQIIDGKRYKVVIGNIVERIPGTDKMGRRFYTVPVKEPGVPANDAADNALGGQNDVAKIPDNGKLPPPTIHEEEPPRIMQQRGRPEKEGIVHRITLWRRKKKNQQSNGIT